MPAIIPTLAFLFGAITIAFGANATFRPVPGLSFFELSAPVSPDAILLLQVLGPVYGVRDIFMGVAVWAAALFGSRKALGIITIALGCVAGVDGAVCKWVVGKGEWNHWGYAPLGIAFGAVILWAGEPKGKKA